MTKYLYDSYQRCNTMSFANVCITSQDQKLPNTRTIHLCICATK